MSGIPMELPGQALFGVYGHEGVGEGVDADAPHGELGIDPNIVAAHDLAPDAGRAHENLGLRTLKASVIINEMLPTDDLMRYGLLLASQEHTGNPLVGAAVMGVATFATEASAVLASSKWIAEDRIRPVLDSVRIKIDSFKDSLNRLIPALRVGRLVPNILKDPEVGKKLPLAAQAVVALNLGSVVLLETMQRRDPSRTAEQNRKHGFRSAALVSGYMAAEGGLLSSGYNNLANPVQLSMAAIGVAALQYGVHKFRQRTERKES